MQAEFWKQRWLEGQTGWHQGEVHPSLIKYFPTLELSVGDKVFVPLCGKSLDMLWLAEQGMQVIGCEISGHAIQAFFDEIKQQPEKTADNELIKWNSGPYTIYEGDYFSLNKSHMEGAKAVYDRASLIALTKDGKRGRKAYMKQMRALFGVDVKTLLITLDYNQLEMDGPPFSVGYEEVIWQYAFDHIIEFLAEDQILDQEAMFRERGLTRLTEWVFKMVRYDPVYATFSDCPQDF